MRRICLKAALCAAVVGFAGFGSSTSAQVGTNAGFASSGIDPMVQRNIADWAVRGKGVTDDWSDRHLVFPNPGTEQEAIKNGTYEQWLKIVNEPRFIKQQIKRAGGAKVLEGASITSFVSPTQSGTKKVALKKDWSMGLGTTAGVLHPNTFPAKYNFSTTGESCSDYVVYPTGLAGTASQASIIAYNNIYTGASPGCTTNVGPPVYWAYNTGGISSLSPVISDDGTQVAFIQTVSSVASLVLLKPGPNATGRTVTGTLSATSPNVTISAGLFSATDVGAQITGTGIPAGDTIASVLSTTTATLATAPTAHASETLTIVSETAAAPGVPILQSNANYPSCVAPCYTTITLNGTTPNDTNSSPFYIYGGGLDTMYVGDNNGKLHQFTGVFYGTPAENTTTDGWPVTVSANILTSPVYDYTFGYVYVGDSGGYLYRVTTASNPNTATASAHLTATGSTGLVDAPLVDEMPASPKVYAFLGDTDSVVQFAYNFASANPGISEALGSSAAGTKVFSGSFDNLHYDIAGGNGGNMYVCGYHNTGTTPRLYQIVMNSTFTGTVNTIATDPASAAATCSPVTEFLGAKANTTLTAAMSGTSGTTATVSSIAGIASGDYIQIDSEIMHVSAAPSGSSVPVTRAQLGTAEAAHSIGAAVQDIQDWIYLSVSANGSGGGTGACTTACLYNYSVTTGTAPTSATAGIAAAGGTSGVIIDNSLTGTGEGQIYYSTLATQACTGNGTTGSGTEVCAVQTSQSAP